MKYNPRQCIELFHLLFLSYFGRKIDKKLYSLKGGCNMRFYLNSIRYSEDMDFDIKTISKETLRKNVNQILDSRPFKQILQSKDMEIQSVHETKQTETTQRWKILLKTSISTIPLPTKIEFSRRNFNKDAVFEVINPNILKQYSLIPIMANHYSIGSMYEQKILALVFRKETQSRDIFDLYLLINSGIKPKFQDKSVLENLSRAKDNASSITFSDFKGQVLAYLMEDYKDQYNDKAIWNSIVETVIKFLDEQDNETD